MTTLKLRAGSERSQYTAVVGEIYIGTIGIPHSYPVLIFPNRVVSGTCGGMTEEP